MKSSDVGGQDRPQAPTAVLRGVIVVVGVAAIVQLLMR
ncbi:hypothetical protein JOD27_002276 [Lentzea nigeriaca]|nr:hypothetical protein [Lentzea nigeriaca]